MSLTRSRVIKPIEYFDINARSIIQWSLEIEDPAFVPVVVDKLINSVVAFHMKIEGDRLVAHDNSVPVVQIPSGMTNLRNISNWFVKEHPVDFSSAFARIACNDRFVSMAISHMCADGGYLKWLLRTMKDPAPPLPPLPTMSSSFFSDEIKRAPRVFAWDTDPHMTRVLSREKKDPNRFNFCQYYTIETQRERLSCYDRRDGKLHGFTEALWMSHVMCALAHKGSLDEDVGVCTCVDLRQWAKADPAKLNPNMVNAFSAVTPSGPLRRGMTVREVANGMRKDMERRIARGEQFGFLNGLIAADREPIPGAGLEITNMGSMVLEKPIVDAFAGLSITATNSVKILSIMSFGKEGYGRNGITMRLRYAPQAFGDREMEVYAKCYDYMIHNVSFDRKVEDVLDEIRAFRKSL